MVQLDPKMGHISKMDCWMVNQTEWKDNMTLVSTIATATLLSYMTWKNFDIKKTRTKMPYQWPKYLRMQWNNGWSSSALYSSKDGSICCILARKGCLSQNFQSFHFCFAQNIMCSYLLVLFCHILLCGQWTTSEPYPCLCEKIPIPIRIVTKFWCERHWLSIDFHKILICCSF